MEVQGGSESAEPILTPSVFKMEAQGGFESAEPILTPFKRPFKYPGINKRMKHKEVYTNIDFAPLPPVTRVKLVQPGWLPY